MNRRIGMSTLLFRSEPRVVSAAAVVAKNENEGSFGGRFDLVLEDDKFGEDSFERAECKMLCTAARLAAERSGLRMQHIRAMLAGDLLNQLITANYAARELGIPYLGLYGACSTMAESLLLGSMLVDGGYCSPVLCCASSHFSTAERQYRYPLEMGTTAPPTAQHTVTGAGAILLSDTETPQPVFSHIVVTAATIGRVIDLGITDMNNMGAAMAPACCDTILAHLEDTGYDADEFDLFVSGDLGAFGSEMLLDLAKKARLDLEGRYLDCGASIYRAEQNFSCGGSGAGCSSVVLASELLGRIERGAVRRMLFLATGALMSPTAGMQGESIPGIAHAVVLERRD
ncbi:MAG: stage V sporulation protein AD [Clostridia bacterium]|nr:stage V sporulation protein AD [Clostridia bacterium]